MPDGTLLTILAALVAGTAGLLVGRTLGLRKARYERRLRGRLRRRYRELRNQMEAQQARLTATGAAVSEALIYLDQHGRVVGVNNSARQWFDLEPDAQRSLMAALRSIEAMAVVEAAQQGERSAQRVVIGSRVFRAEAAVLPDGGAALALRDDTAVERLSRARRDLVSNVSHDLRTPLAAVRLLVERLLDADQPEVRTVAAQIRDQVATLEELAEGLVELGRLESGRALFRLQPVALHDLAQQAADALGPQMADSGIRIRNDIPPALEVLADEPHVTRVFTNLLDNARRYSPAGETIRLAAVPSGDEPDRVEVTITDAGPGIPPADIDRVFERFYRGDRSRSDGRTGLGLAIARHVVEGHGGTIGAENTPGAGATFRFTLPRAE